jgi:hypothetical protein
MSSQLHASDALTPASIRQEARCASYSVRNGSENLALAGNRTPVIQLVTLLTEISEVIFAPCVIIWYVNIFVKKNVNAFLDAMDYTRRNISK